MNYVLLVILMFWASVSLLGRFFLLDVPNYKNRIETEIASKSGLQVSIGDLRGRWLYFSPLFEIENVVVLSDPENAINTGETQSGSNENIRQAVSLEYLAVELDLFESVFTLSPRIKRLMVDGVELSLSLNDESKKLVVDGLPVKKSSNTLQQMKTVVEDIILTSEQIYLRDILLNITIPESGLDSVYIANSRLDNEWVGHNLSSKIELRDESEIPREISIQTTFYGSPFELETLSAKSYAGFESSDLNFWLQHRLFPKHPDFSVTDLEGGLDLWFEINQGIIKNIQMFVGIEQLRIQKEKNEGVEQNIALDKEGLERGEVFEEKPNSENEKLKENHPNDAPTLMTESTSFQNIALSLEGLTNIDLTQIKDRQYLKSTMLENAELKGELLDLHWEEERLQDIEFLLVRKKSTFKGNPLKASWDVVSESGLENASRQASYLLLSEIPLSVSKNIAFFLPQESKARELIRGLSIQGVLSEIEFVAYDLFESPINQNSDIYASLRAKNLGISSFEKIPGVKGVDFYAEYSPKVLGIELETKQALLEKDYYLFREDLRIDNLYGNLLLEFLPGDIVVHSDITQLKNEWLSARILFSASAPERFYADGSREIPAWSIQAELDPIPVEKSRLFFLGKLPPSFLQWVDGFLQSGEIEGDVFLFAFGKKRLPDTFAMLLGDLEIRNADLDYLPGKWPMLNAVSGEILVQNDQVRASIPSAKVFNSRLYSGEVFIESYLNENLPRVKVSADASGGLSDLQRLFLESELKDSLGSVVKDWVLHGNYQSNISLDIPLLENEQQAPASIDVSVNVDDALLAVPEVKLGVKNLDTKLKYSLQEGLSSDSISALFFDKTLSGKIDTIDVNGEQVIQVFGKGEIEAKNLKEWQDFWLFENLQGQTAFDAKILIGELANIDTLEKPLGRANSPAFKTRKEENILEDKQSVVRVALNTDMEGLSVSLPGEYAKQVEEKQESKMQLDILEESLVYRMQYGEQIGVAAETQKEEFSRARIQFGTGDFSLPREEGLVVMGQVAYLSFDEWLDYIEQNLIDEETQGEQQTISVSSDGKAEDPVSFVKRIDLNILEFSGFGQSLEDLDVFATRESFKWNVELKNKNIQGKLLVPDEELMSKENPIIANLEYLKISDEQLSGNAASSSPTENNDVENAVTDKSEYKPDDFVFANLDVKNMHLGKTKHGRWRIDLQPDGTGMDFKVHQLNYGLMTINGEGRWDYSEENSVTRFKGRLRTSAATKVFSALNLRPSSDSAGLMAIELKWPGSPMDFDYEKMQGKAGLKIFDGSIVEVDIKSKKFRALGIFNLGVLTDIITLRVFKKIGKGLNDALTGESDSDKRDKKD